MDYASMHGPGISNFSSPSPHRLPTVSAAQALQDLKTSPTRCISSGLRDLDAVLQSRDPSTISEEDFFHGGVSKGQVTEIYGPPGVGKTAFGMQLAASALHAGEGVIWVGRGLWLTINFTDGSYPVSGPRFSQIIQSFQPLVPSAAPVSSSPPEQRIKVNPADNLTHFSTPSLAHLLALLTNQTPHHPDPKTSLIIIDSFSTLISSAFPRTMDSSSTPRKPGVTPNPSSRKFPVLQLLINSFQKLAATRNISIVVFSQCVTKMRQGAGAGAVLVPAINSTAWEQGLGCRVAIFRDWGWNDGDGNSINDVRLVEVVKAEGVGATNGRGRLVGFSIGETGLRHLILPTNPTPQQRSPVPPNLAQNQNQNQTESPTLPVPKKRKLSAANFEIPDSDAEDDEDYGWAEEGEEDIPAMPPQWQGSEDILVPPPEELEAEDQGAEEDPETAEEEESTNVGLGGKEEIVDSEDELAL